VPKNIRHCGSERSAFSHFLDSISQKALAKREIPKHPQARDKDRFGGKVWRPGANVVPKHLPDVLCQRMLDCSAGRDAAVSASDLPGSPIICLGHSLHGLMPVSSIRAESRGITLPAKS
jgi:hypothetical protein